MSKTSLELLSELKENSKKTNTLVSDFGINAKFLLELGGKFLFGQLGQEDLEALKSSISGVSEFMEEIKQRLES